LLRGRLELNAPLGGAAVGVEQRRVALGEVVLQRVTLGTRL
jgi:hypothetical protein